MSSRKDKLVAKIQAALAGAEGKYAAAAAEAAAATKRMDKFDAERAKLQKELDAHREATIHPTLSPPSSLCSPAGPVLGLAKG